jgi:hypothetical protein
MIGTDALITDPVRINELTTTERFSFEAGSLAEIQLGALRTVFSQLVDGMPVLQRFAEENGLTEIRRIEDGALLLFPHTLYKSYPLSAIENNRFDSMTRWLASLTTLDLSAVDAAGCSSIDEWLALLDAQTEIRIKHSSGTTGKLSFIPNNIHEARIQVQTLRGYLQGFGDEPDADFVLGKDLPMISFAARRGSMAAARQIDAIVAHLYEGDESMVFPTNPGRISADLLSIGGRLEGAAARGEVGKLQLSPTLMARREQLLREQAEVPKRLTAFFESVSTRLRGRRVFLNGILPALVDTALAGVAQGFERLFAPDSVYMCVGGDKGRAFPADYQAQVERFTGAAFPRCGYGMSEGVSVVSRMCPAGYYHINPTIIPYLLDPHSGELLPRTGTQTGRYGIIDLATQRRWGGFLSGDEVTVHWGDREACACGRRGAYLETTIRRYSASEGGDDKITCAGATGAHDRALDLIADIVA